MGRGSPRRGSRKREKRHKIESEQTHNRMILIGHIKTHNTKSRCGNPSNTFTKHPKVPVPWSFRRFHVCNLTMVWVRPTNVDVIFVFTFNRSSYPTTSAVPPVSFLTIHPGEIQILWSQTVRRRKNKRKRIKVGKSSGSIPGTSAQQKKRHPRNESYEKKGKLDE